MTIIRLDGASVALAGSVKGYSGSALWAHLKAQGASVSDNPTKDADMMLVGANPSYTKVDKAKSLGLTLIEGDALHTLLEEGELELEEAPVRPLAELIADARAVFDGPPSRQAWASICALADECDDAHIDDFIAYLAPQLDAWPRVVDHTLYSAEYTSGPFMSGAGEVRLMPAGWLTAMLSGVEHPKFRLAKAISFTSAAVNSTLSSKIFDNPCLSHIRTFDVGVNVKQNVKKKSFYKKMAKCSHLGSVDTLMLSEAPAGVFEVFSGSTSMPNLKRLFLRPSLDGHGADPEVAIFGPWASQLECVSVGRTRDLDRIHARRDELPALNTIGLEMHYFVGARDLRAFSAAGAKVAATVDNVLLAVSSLSESDHSQRFGYILDRLKTPLKVLDLTGCVISSWHEKDATSFFMKRVVERGLGARVGSLVVNESVPVQTCAALREAGVDLVTPLDASTGALEVPSFEHVDEPAPGEAARVAARQVHLHDAMMFSAPSAAGWRTLAGVVDGLELQLEPDAFAAVVDTLEAYLEGWPARLRMAPKHWMGEFSSDVPSPKIRLVRGLELHCGYVELKSVVRIWGRLVEAGNLGLIDHIRLNEVQNSKPYLKAITEVFDAARPSSYTALGREWRYARKALKAKGLMEDVNPDTDRWTTAWDSDLGVLDDREISLTIKDAASLQVLLDREDMDHVVSLQLHLSMYSGSGRDELEACAALRAEPASWKRLRHLSVNTRGDMACYAPLVTWLSGANPVHIDHGFEHDFYYKAPSVQFAKKGFYARAYGSTLELSEKETLADVASVVGRDDVHVAVFTASRHGYRMDLPGVVEVVDAMDPSLRASLRSLRWEIEPGAFERVDAMLAALPSLTSLSLIGDSLLTRAGRRPLLEAFAASEASNRIKRFTTSALSSRIEGPVSAELKILAKGAGFDSSMWLVSDG